MENQPLQQNLLRALQGLSDSYGTGSLVTDVLSVACGLSAIALFLGIAAYRKSLSSSTSVDTDSVLAQTERLERSLRDFRMDLSRLQEELRVDITFFKQESADIRRMLTEVKNPVPTSDTSSFGMGVSSGVGGKRSHGAVRGDSEPVRYREARPSGGQSAHTQTPSVENPIAASPDRGDPSKSKASAPETLSQRLKTTRKGILEKILGVFAQRPELNQDTLDELEVLLVTSDLGVRTVGVLLEEVKQEVARGAPVNQQLLITLLKKKIVKMLEKGRLSETAIRPIAQVDGPLVVMIVGVNGAGKTTTAAKLANSWRRTGAKVMLAAADTFRAGAYEQLRQWGETVGVPVIGGAQDARPSTIVFDALKEAKARQIDVLIVDTAGRLHNKSHLMQELEGIRNILSKHQPSAPHETLLVLDGTTGQNGIAQAKEFNAAVPLTGLIITKLDGTAKGGIVVAIKEDLGIPIRYIGVGESWSDLRTFDAEDFADALFDPGEADAASAHGEERSKKRRSSGTAIIGEQ